MFTEQEEIIGLYLKRDENAIFETKNKYQSYLQKIAYNILGNTQTAEECLNDTYLRAWNTIPPQKPTVLRAYLIRILKNICIDRYRAEHSQKRLSTVYTEALEELSEISNGEFSIQTETEAKELSLAIESFLSKINKNEKNAFILRYYYCCSVESIAEKLDLSPVNVRQLLFRARKKLKEYLISEDYL